jgi:Glycosyltransferase family 87
VRLAFRNLSTPICLGLAPIVVLLTSLYFYATTGSRYGATAPDFRYGLYRQVKGLIHAGIAFDPVTSPVTGENRIYTVFTTLLATPFALLPAGAAADAATALLIAAAIGTLWVLGVRDWRAYGATFLGAPVIAAIETGNLTLVLGFVAALAWRFRGRPLLAGALVGLAIALKLFMWPLGLWLLATRRFAGTAVAAGVALASFALVLPFGSPIAFLRISRAVASVYQHESYSFYVLFGQTAAARGIWLAAGLLVLAAAFATSRDEAAFTWALVACLLFSPIVWIHYFALLLVPIAIARPRFSPLWLVPLLFWLVPFGAPAPWQIVLALGATLCVAGWIAWSPARVGHGSASVGLDPSSGTHRPNAWIHARPAP